MTTITIKSTMMTPTTTKDFRQPCPFFTFGGWYPGAGVAW